MLPLPRTSAWRATSGSARSSCAAEPARRSARGGWRGDWLDAAIGSIDRQQVDPLVPRRTAAVEPVEPAAGRARERSVGGERGVERGAQRRIGGGSVARDLPRGRPAPLLTV